MLAPHISLLVHTSKSDDEVVHERKKIHQSTKNLKAQTRKCKESRPRFNIFYSFSSGDAIFEGGWPLVRPPSPPFCVSAETHSLSAVTSIHAFQFAN